MYLWLPRKYFIMKTVIYWHCEDDWMMKYSPPQMNSNFMISVTKLTDIVRWFAVANQKFLFICEGQPCRVRILVDVCSRSNLMIIAWSKFDNGIHKFFISHPHWTMSLRVYFCYTITCMIAYSVYIVNPVNFENVIKVRGKHGAPSCS